MPNQPLLHELHVLGLRTFGSLAFGEGDALAFAKLFEGSTLELRRMEEQVLRLAGADESKSFVHESLNGSFGHHESFEKKRRSNRSLHEVNRHWPGSRHVARLSYGARQHRFGYKPSVTVAVSPVNHI